jgi:hypothetical protein
VFTSVKAETEIIRALLNIIIPSPSTILMYSSADVRTTISPEWSRV